MLIGAYDANFTTWISIITESQKKRRTYSTTYCSLLYELARTFVKPSGNLF